MGVLKKNESDDEFKFMISIMEEVHYVRMNRSVNKEIEFTKDIFERVVKKLENIAFARGGAHLPTAHALRLLSTGELRFGLTKLNFFLKIL